MRAFVLFVTLVFGLASQAVAQSSIGLGSGRPGGLIQGGPGSVAGPPGATPSRGVSTVKPGIPDARLGAGGVRATSGNIVFPGTPNDRSVGNILSPGIPSLQPIPSIVQPVQSRPQPQPPLEGRKGRHSERRFIGAYPIYGVYAYPMAPNVIAVTGSTVTRSGSSYVVTVGGEEPAPAEQAVAQPAAPETPYEASDPDYWLIALQGGLIYAVSDYVIEERAFRFVTLQGDEYVVPLAELDRDFTAKLNRDRGVEIELD